MNKLLYVLVGAAILFFAAYKFGARVQENIEAAVITPVAFYTIAPGVPVTPSAVPNTTPVSTLVSKPVVVTQSTTSSTSKPQDWGSAGTVLGSLSVIFAIVILIVAWHERRKKVPGPFIEWPGAGR